MAETMADWSREEASCGVRPGKVRWSSSRAKLAAALAKAQRQVKGAVKDSENPHYKSKYADLAAVADACRDALTENGIAFPQPAWTEEDGRVVVTTCLVHESGEWMESDLSVKPQQQGPQALGSCITYLRRYGLAAAAGVAPEDDDGESAEGRAPGQDPAPASTRSSLAGQRGPVREVDFPVVDGRQKGNAGR